MKTKLNLVSTKSVFVYSIVFALIVLAVNLTGCKKDANSVTTEQGISETTNGAVSKLLPASFIIANGSSAQSFSISCTCGDGFMVSSSQALYYSSSSAYGWTFTDGNPHYLAFNQYYYIIPLGGSYGANTKCLKIKFNNGTNDPRCSYNPTTNTWTGLGSTANYSATQVNLSLVPYCTPC